MQKQGRTGQEGMAGERIGSTCPYLLRTEPIGQSGGHHQESAGPALIQAISGSISLSCLHHLQHDRPVLACQYKVRSHDVAN